MEWCLSVYHRSRGCAVFRVLTPHERPTQAMAGSKVDRALVIVLSGNGPTYANRTDAQNDGTLRRVGYFYLTMEFANKVFREALYAAGHPDQVADRLIKDLVEHGNETYELMPRDTSGVVWFNMFEDLVRSRMFVDLRARLRHNMMNRDEMEHISIDCTLRVCRTIIGQADYRAPAEERNAAIFPDGVAKRKILTVIGRTGSCVLLKAITEESAQSYADTMNEEFCSDELANVMTVRTDNASGAQWKALKDVLPNLMILCEDTVHISMTYEMCFFKKSTEGSAVLRSIMDMFNKVDANRDSDCYGPVYTTGDPPALTRAEEMMRKRILVEGINKEEAAELLKATDFNSPMTSTAQFIKLLMAHVSVYDEEVKRISHVRVGGKGQSIRKLIYNMTDPTRMQYLFNNTRMRASILPHRLPLLPKGSTANEALHYKLNKRFMNQKELHLSTLELQLELFWASHEMAHDCAYRTPNITQIRPRSVLARRLLNVGFDAVSWADHVKAVVTLPLAELRKTTRALMAVVYKRPAARRPIKRTKFTTKRVTVMRRFQKKRPVKCVSRRVRVTGKRAP